MCPVDTTSATNQPYDFSSLLPHIDMESASSKAPKNPFSNGSNNFKLNQWLHLYVAMGWRRP